MIRIHRSAFSPAGGIHLGSSLLLVVGVLGCTTRWETYRAESYRLKLVAEPTADESPVRDLRLRVTDDLGMDWNPAADDPLIHSAVYGGCVRKSYFLGIPLAGDPVPRYPRFVRILMDDARFVRPPEDIEIDRFLESQDGVRELILTLPCLTRRRQE